jgi:glycerol dehydrogenase
MAGIISAIEVIDFWQGKVMRKALICPAKYVQGENELLNLGYFVSTFGRSALLIAHADDVSRVDRQLKETAAKYGVSFIASGFDGECSRQEVTRLGTLAEETGCECIVGLGGGKAIDTAKCVAKGGALIIAPTIAATDAPTSHSAVLYTPDGAFDDYAYFKQSPGVVLVDTAVIANAPARFLVSGMGDALSTYFEARATARACANVNAGLPCGYHEGLTSAAKPTKAALALAELCYRTLLEDGVKAKRACERNVVTGALENIVEANILLSGLGFESGGLAAAHAIHDGLTILEGTHDYFHGEKVAFGTLAQLALENAPTEEMEEVLGFCASVGLPVCLADIGVDEVSADELLAVSEKACIEEESVHSMPFPVTAEAVAAALTCADAIGCAYKARRGERPAPAREGHACGPERFR